MTDQLPFDNPNPDDTYEDDPADATDRMLDVIAAVDFLRRGDHRGLTLWAAIEEALRWWIAERLVLLEGVQDPDIGAPRFGEPDPLQGTLTRFLAAASIDEPIHISVALQQALRRWTSSVSMEFNDKAPWPHPRTRDSFPVPTEIDASLASIVPNRSEAIK